MFARRLLIGVIFNAALYGGLLFFPARTLNWWRAWVLLGVVVLATVVTMLSVLRSRQGLLNERFKPVIQKGQPLADKIVLLLFLAAFFDLIVFIPLDVFHFHLLEKPGTFVSSAGLVLVIAGWWIISLSFKENAFAAPVVKHQRERQHTVVDTGVYAIVRHPMYVGVILKIIGMPLWLESYAATLLSSILIGLLAVRIVFEERFLLRELKGYDAYVEKVRYRLVPFLW